MTIPASTTVEIKRMQLRRGSSAEWSASNPILEDGEEGYEKDTGRRKVGDGETPWNLLEYNISSTGGTGGDGTPGPAGPGPYEEAVAAGIYTGTKEDFYNVYLQGPKGDPGDGSGTSQSNVTPILRPTSSFTLVAESATTALVRSNFLVDGICYIPEDEVLDFPINTIIPISRAGAKLTVVSGATTPVGQVAPKTFLGGFVNSTVSLSCPVVMPSGIAIGDLVAVRISLPTTAVAADFDPLPAPWVNRLTRGGPSGAAIWTIWHVVTAETIGQFGAGATFTFVHGHTGTPASWVVSVFSGADPVSPYDLHVVGTNSTSTTPVGTTNRPGGLEVATKAAATTTFVEAFPGLPAGFTLGGQAQTNPLVAGDVAPVTRGSGNSQIVVAYGVVGGLPERVAVGGRAFTGGKYGGTTTDVIVPPGMPKVKINSSGGYSISDPFSSITLMKVGPNEWDLEGNLGV